MKRFLYAFTLFLVLRGASLTALAETPSQKSSEDFLTQYAETRGFSLGLPSAHKWTPDGREVLFLRSPSRSFVRDLYVFNVVKREEKLLLSAEQILNGAEEQLSIEERARRERMRMTARGIASFELSSDGNRILVPLSGSLYVIERESGKVTELRSDAGYPTDAKFSPDGTKVSCVRDGDLYIVDIESGRESRLTHRPSKDITHATAEFVAQEEMRRRTGYWWSPDSKLIAYQRTDESMVETLYIADAGRPESAPQSWRYPRPGKANAEVTLGVISVEGGETSWIEWDRKAFPYLCYVRWEEDSPLTILVENRRQTEIVLLAVDEKNGATRELLRERDNAWINLDEAAPKWLPDGSGFLWTTERRGGWQLELRDNNGALSRVLTPLELDLRDILSIDKDSKEAIFVASKKPTETHLYAIDLKDEGSVPRQLSEGPGNHGGVFSPDHATSVRWSSTLEGRTPQRVLEGEGIVLGMLKSEAEEPPLIPEVELTMTNTDPPFHASVVRPRDFDPTKRYPVIENVYGGPSGGMVSSSAFAYFIDQWIADRGFIVVRIDGRGTTYRGREWSRAIKGNFIDAPLADHVEALKALGRQYAELDLSRVGVFGWSFGGYFSAMATARHPEIYRAGVAGAPVADWLDYDTHYTERYLGLPDENPEGYRKSSVLTYADQLERPLLIIHGTTDDNVYFTHSLKLSDALFRAGKQHEFLPLSNFTHMVADPLFTKRQYERIIGFFERHLAD